MRQIETHRQSTTQCPYLPLNDRIMIELGDDPDDNGIHHRYQPYVQQNGQWQKHGSPLIFHKGPLYDAETKVPEKRELAVNGLSNEVLLGVVLHRLQCAQAGKSACRENAIAATKLEECLHWLHARTADRIRRGADGKVEK